MMQPPCSYQRAVGIHSDGSLLQLFGVVNVQVRGLRLSTKKLRLQTLLVKHVWRFASSLWNCFQAGGSEQERKTASDSQ